MAFETLKQGLLSRANQIRQNQFNQNDPLRQLQVQGQELQNESNTEKLKREQNLINSRKIVNKFLLEAQNAPIESLGFSDKELDLIKDLEGRGDQRSITRMKFSKMATKRDENGQLVNQELFNSLGNLDPEFVDSFTSIGSGRTSGQQGQLEAINLRANREAENIKLRGKEDRKTAKFNQQLRIGEDAFKTNENIREATAKGGIKAGLAQYKSQLDVWEDQVRKGQITQKQAVELALNADELFDEMESQLQEQSFFGNKDTPASKAFRRKVDELKANPESTMQDVKDLMQGKGLEEVRESIPQPNNSQQSSTPKSQNKANLAQSLTIDKERGLPLLGGEPMIFPKKSGGTVTITLDMWNKMNKKQKAAVRRANKERILGN